MTDVLAADATDGSAGNPLVGTWTMSKMYTGMTPTGTVTVTFTMYLNANGTTATDVVNSACTGMLHTSGYTWSSTATMIAFAGTAMCTGMPMCSNGVSFDCSSPLADVMGPNTFRYLLTNSNNALAIDNPLITEMWTRTM